MIPGLEEHQRLLHGSHIAPIPGVCYGRCQHSWNSVLVWAWGSLCHEPFFVPRFARVSSSSGDLLLLLFFKNTMLSQHCVARCRVFCTLAFFFAWCRAGGPVLIFKAPFDHVHPWGGSTPDSGRVAIHPGLSCPPHQWPGVGPSLMIPREGQTWCSVGCRYLTSNSFLL